MYSLTTQFPRKHSYSAHPIYTFLGFCVFRSFPDYVNISLQYVTMCSMILQFGYVSILTTFQSCLYLRSRLKTMMMMITRNIRQRWFERQLTNIPKALHSFANDANAVHKHSQSDPSSQLKISTAKYHFIFTSV